MKKLRLAAVTLAILQMLTLAAGAIESIDIDAKAAILVDASDGHPVYEKNADTKQYPASLTKLMTALLVIESVSDLNEVITAKESAFEGLSDAGSTVNIKAEEKMSVDNLLICLLVASANEAANILAERVSGSVPLFVELMNKRAEELGLTGTKFANPSGLHEEGHYTTARDIAVVAREVQKHERLREICAMEKATIPATNISEERFFFTTNSLISLYKEREYKYSKATGMKTGSTTPAGLCLVASAESKDTEYISVILGAKKEDKKGGKMNFVESKRLLIWGFENFRRAKLLNASQPVTEVKVELARERDYVVAQPKSDYDVLMPSDYDEKLLEIIPDTPSTIDAPITKGEEIGKVLVRYDGKDYATIPLIAADNVERSLILYIFKLIKGFFKNPITIVVIVAFILLIIWYIAFVIRYNKRRKNRRRRYYR